MQIGSICTGCTKSHIGHTVTEFDKRGIRSCPDAGIVLLTSPFLTGATFIIGQGIDYLCCHGGLTVCHIPAGRLHDIIIGEAGILYTVMVIGGKEDRQNILLTGCHFLYMVSDQTGYHLKMVTIRKVRTIGLSYAVMKAESSLPDSTDCLSEVLKNLV